MRLSRSLLKGDHHENTQEIQYILSLLQSSYTACGGKGKKGTGIDVNQDNTAKVQTYGNWQLGKILKSAWWRQTHKEDKSQVQMFNMQESTYQKMLQGRKI